MHAEYCDRPYEWDREFNKEDGVKVLVIGNSFGRDWANILHEYEKLDVVYFYYSEEAMNFHESVIKNADIVFYGTGPEWEEIPETVLQLIPSNKLYIIGNKNFGKSNGIIYAKRYEDDYLLIYN